MLSTDELEALQLGMRLMVKAGDPELSTAGMRLQAKIDAVVPSAEQGQKSGENIEVLLQKLDRDYVFLPRLRRAVRDKTRLKLTYKRLDDVMTFRIIRPLHLEYWGRSWTVTSWCENRDDFRVFRIDRIENIMEQGPFKNEAGKEFKDYAKRWVEY